MDALILSAYSNNNWDGKTMSNTTIQDWLIVEESIRAHVATMDSNLDGKILIRRCQIDWNFQS